MGDIDKLKIANCNFVVSPGARWVNFWADRGGGKETGGWRPEFLWQDFKGQEKNFNTKKTKRGRRTRREDYLTRIGAEGAEIA